MAIGRTCLAFASGLACAAAAAGAPVPRHDDNCLVQSSVVIARESALAPNLPSPLAHFNVDVPALVRGVAKRIPGLTVAPIPGIEDYGNLSMADLMTYGMELLRVFGNETVVSAMNDSLHEISAGLLNFSKNILSDTKELLAEVDAADAAGSKEEVMAALEKFMISQTKELVDMAADALFGARSFVHVLPVDLSIVKMMYALFALTDGFTKADAKALMWDKFLEPLLKVLFRNESTYCRGIGPFVPNITMVSKMLKYKSAGWLDSARLLIPRIKPMVQGLAPDVAPVILKLANISFDEADKVLAAARESVPQSASALLMVSHESVGCSFQPPYQHQQSAAAPRSFGLLAVAMAAGAWLAVA